MDQKILNLIETVINSVLESEEVDVEHATDALAMCNQLVASSRLLLQENELIRDENSRIRALNEANNLLLEQAAEENKALAKALRFYANEMQDKGLIAKEALASGIYDERIGFVPYTEIEQAVSEALSKESLSDDC